MHRLPRVLDMQGVVRDVIHVGAISLLCVVMSVNVDDFGLQRYGAASRVLEELTGASKMLRRLLKTTD
eukprot:5741727-Pyramimonas_sp.AAC.1